MDNKIIVIAGDGSALVGAMLVKMEDVVIVADLDDISEPRYVLRPPPAPLHYIGTDPPRTQKKGGCAPHNYQNDGGRWICHCGKKL